MKIGFLWFGLKGRYGHWDDGLKAAMRIIEKHHEVHYIEPTDDFSAMDVLLFWEAGCTRDGKDGAMYKKVQESPIRKALLFAGGPIKDEYFQNFDMVFVESAINEDELSVYGIPNKRAFGVNTDMFKPEKQPKIWDGAFQATCASWKRLELFSKALGDRGVTCGRFQSEDPQPHIDCRANGTMVFPEISYPAINSLINASHTVVNCSEMWGGGQRTTLESMAAGIPVIVMSDSPKNREFVEESGAGLIVEPKPEKIREAILTIKTWSEDEKRKGRKYVEGKWSQNHYANSILEWL